MNTIDEIRLHNARILLKMAGKQKTMVNITGRQQSQISQLMGRNPTKPIGGAIARSLELSFSKPKGWLDQLHYDSVIEHNKYKIAESDSYQFTNANQPTIKWVPHISWDQAVNWNNTDYSKLGDDIKWFPAYKNIGGRSFILTVNNNSMVNLHVNRSYPESSLIFVDPDVMINNGDYVIAKLRDNPQATFKKLIIDSNKKFLVSINASMANMVLCEPFEVIGTVAWGII